MQYKIINALFTGVCVSLLSGESLIIPQLDGNSPGSRTSDELKSMNKLYAKCKLADWSGHSHNKSFAEVKTPYIIATSNPDWGEYPFFLRASDGFDNAVYVRVEIIACSGNLISNVSLGAIFIPLEYFSKKEKEYKFPIVRFRQSTVPIGNI